MAPLQGAALGLGEAIDASSQVGVPAATLADVRALQGRVLKALSDREQATARLEVAIKAGRLGLKRKAADMGCIADELMDATWKAQAVFVEGKLVREGKTTLTDLRATARTRADQLAV